MLIATFKLDLEAIALDEAFEEVPGMTVEAERIAAHGTQWTMPCLWVAASDFDVVDEAIASDPSVDEVVETNEFGGEKYYNVDWSDEVNERVTDYVDKEGSVLRAEATGDGWEVQFRFVERDQFDAFRELLSERGHSFQLLELFEPGSPRQTTGEVTPGQRDALVTAAERGYFEVPRETSARELAEELGMAQQSLSELLRRGTDSLVRSALMTGTDEDDS